MILEKCLTPKQKAAFWRAFAAARLVVQPQDQDSWRHNILIEETGKFSLLDLDRKGDFEAVMRRLWSEAGNWEEAVRYSVGDERRAAFLIKVVAAQVLQLMDDETTRAAAYVAGVLRQSRLVTNAVAERGDFWLDIPLANALKVFQMLDTHRRRLLKSTGHDGKSAAFSPNIRYRRDGHSILVVERVAPAFYAAAAAPFVQVRRDER